MPDPFGRLAALLQLLYAAPGDPPAWQTFLEALTVAINGGATGFVVYDPATHRGNMALGVRMDPADKQEYDAHWVKEDPWGTSPRWTELGPGRVVLGEELVPRSDLRKTAYYNDYARRIGLTQCVAGLIEQRDGRFAFLAIDRGEREPAFESADVALLTAIMPHLQQALQVHRRLVVAEGFATGAVDAFDALGEALFVVDRSARVVRLNRAAELLLLGPNGVALQDGALSFASAAATAELRTAIGHAVTTSARGGYANGGRFVVARSSGGPMRVLVSPSRSAHDFLGFDAHALVLIDARDRRVVDGATLRRMFDLTEAETRLACALANGRTLRQAASDLGLREGTVRTRLKTIFHKTGTHRQVDLVVLLRQAGEASGTFDS
jgi:DNA-binding CsgD family transcriptional regulator